MQKNSEQNGEFFVVDGRYLIHLLSQKAGNDDSIMFGSIKSLSIKLFASSCATDPHVQIESNQLNDIVF